MIPYFYTQSYPSTLQNGTYPCSLYMDFLPPHPPPSPAPSHTHTHPALLVLTSLLNWTLFFLFFIFFRFLCCSSPYLCRNKLKSLTKQAEFLGGVTSDFSLIPVPRTPIHVQDAVPRVSNNCNMGYNLSTQISIQQLTLAQQTYSSQLNRQFNSVNRILPVLSLKQHVVQFTILERFISP